MKRTLGILMIGLVGLAAVPLSPAFASEPAIGPGPAQFQALASMPDARQRELVAMTDDQLAAVEGAAVFCFVCINAARIRQLNVSVASFQTLQSNTAIVLQRN